MDLMACVGKQKLKTSINEFKVVLHKDLPVGTKIIDSVWAMKKKNNGTLRG